MARLTVAAAILAAACSSPEAADGGGEGAAERWTLGPASLEIGTVEGETPYLLHQVTDAARLPDGRVAVLNAGSGEVRIYDATGSHVRSFGGEGDGPGEFRDPVRLRRGGPDTLAVVDQGLRRTTTFTAEGEVVGVEELPVSVDQPFPAETWLFRRHWIDGGRPGRRAGVARLLAALPPPDTAASYRYAKVADDGRLWITDEVPPWPEGTSWTVREADGTFRAEVESPPRFFPFRIGEEEVVGVRTDSIEVQRVVVLPLRKPAGSPPGPGRRALLEPGPEPIRAEGIPADALVSTRGLIRMMMSLQEVHYGRSMEEGGGTYSTSLEALTEVGQGRLRLEIPEGSRAAILSADSRHWIGETVHQPTGTHCVVSIRAPRMVGLPPGRVLCWVETPPEPLQDAER